MRRRPLRFLCALPYFNLIAAFYLEIYGDIGLRIYVKRFITYINKNVE